MNVIAGQAWLPVVRELFADALSNLRQQRQRTMLALLGIVIGTAAVVAMLMIGHNAQQEAIRQFGMMGADLLIVQQNNLDNTPARMTAPQVETLPERQPMIVAAVPIATGFGVARAGYQKVQAGLLGATPGFAAMAGLQMRSGRFLTPFDNDATFAILGSDAARQLSAPGRPMEVGQQLRVGDYLFSVIGVLEKSRPVGMLPVNLDSAVIVPLASARRIMDPGVNGAIARMAPGVDDIAATAAVTQAVQQGARGVTVQVQSARQLIETLKKQMTLYTGLLAAIGGISLLVGGVGVMNVMLMSVIERRREIGLRVALGARSQDIMWMVLIEALALSLAGGVAGALLGLGAAIAWAAAWGWSFSAAPYAIPLGVGVATIVGLASGLHPAMAAARLNPVAALRSE